MSVSSVLILTVVCFNLITQETTRICLSECLSLGSSLNEAKVTTVVLTFNLPKDTAYWIVPMRD